MDKLLFSTAFAWNRYIDPSEETGISGKDLPLLFSVIVITFCFFCINVSIFKDKFEGGTLWLLSFVMAVLSCGVIGEKYFSILGVVCFLFIILTGNKK